MSRLVKSYSKYLLLLTFVFTLVGCSDELDYPHSTVEPGLPATISVNVSLPEMTPLTRADIRDGLDNKVESLWIGVYNAASGERTCSQPVDVSEVIVEPEFKSVKISTKTGSSYIVAVANYKGVNNKCRMDGYDTDLTFEEALQAADTYEKFKSISARMNDNGDIITAAPLNALLMSGSFMENNSHASIADPQPVDIPKSGTLNGAIHLRRLISQIKFDVKYNPENISDFEVLSYQVHKVPNQSWLYDCKRETALMNAGDERTIGSLGSYQSSEPDNQFTTAKDTYNGNPITKWSFDWWQFENKRTGLDWVAKYADREVEHKDGGLNTGDYASLVVAGETDPDKIKNNNATFVELKVRMKMKRQKNSAEEYEDIPQNQQRIVDAVYTIHLGYLDGNSESDKAKDFNSLRNCIYTYTVKIEDAYNILLEAKKQGEKQPGAEGTISDVSEKYVELDAHYGVYNIEITSDDLTGQGFRYIIRCYDANSKLIVIDSDDVEKNGLDEKYRKYLDWVEIMSTTGKDVLAKYKEEGKKIYKLDEFKRKGIKAGWYTVFFNEYVYDDESWPAYVNKPERQLWIRVQEAQSSDKESTWYNSKYAFSQKSIQTFYSSGPTALGIEHDNESYGLNLRNSFHTDEINKNINRENGRYNAYLYLGSKKWSDFIHFGEFQEVNGISNTELDITEPAKTLENGFPVALPLIKSYKETSKNDATSDSYDPDQSASRKYIEAINACMNRNRDLNGDDIITPNEIRWYVPTTNQYTQIILGTRSLSTPINGFKKNKLSARVEQVVEKNHDQCSQDMDLFLYGSNGAVVWTMEGFTTSNWSAGGYGNKNRPTYTMGAPWDVRCVRNLGTDNSKTPDQNGSEITVAYEKRSGKNIVDMTYYESKSIRGELLTTMSPHPITDWDHNSTYKSFEYKPNNEYYWGSIKNEYNFKISDYSYFEKGFENAGHWKNWLADEEKNPCKRYNVNGETGWRVPNQKELMVLMALGIDPGKDGRHISATFSHYSNDDKNGPTAYTSSSDLGNHYIMYVEGNDNPHGVQDGFDSSKRLRCVRDWYPGIK